jgi:hypothetical protein
LGEGGVGVFVGGGGKIGSVVKEYSAVLSVECCTLDDVREDSDVGVEGDDERLSSDVVAGVIVSARGRETKRPCALGWYLQASVIVWVDDRCLG